MRRNQKFAARKLPLILIKTFAGSWRPIGHMRPSSPLLDSVRDQFEDYDQLAKDFTRMFLNSEANTLVNSQLFDVVFLVGQSKQKVGIFIFNKNSYKYWFPNYLLPHVQLPFPFFILNIDELIFFCFFFCRSLSSEFLPSPALYLLHL